MSFVEQIIPGGIVTGTESQVQAGAIAIAIDITITIPTIASATGYFQTGFDGTEEPLSENGSWIIP